MLSIAVAGTMSSANELEFKTACAFLLHKVEVASTGYPPKETPGSLAVSKVAGAIVLYEVKVATTGS